ncbi:MAG: ANTAR domain-containing protein [Lachnospiraceae bacterium]|nr:ANTAR domain-containing protein [Lachnospiraceae bacterium]
MTNIIVVFPKIEDTKSMKNLLVRNGFHVVGVCTTGTQAISQADGLNGGIVICSYKMVDMLYSELHDYLPFGFEMLMLASRQYLNECQNHDIMCLEMPLKVPDFLSTVGMMAENMERRKKKQRLQPKERNREEKELIKEAKGLLMERNHMTEEEAHRYIQKNSMDSGTNMVETAQMILSMMKMS